MQTVSQRLALLRQRMALRGLDACVVVTDDFHGSEYVGDHFKTRAYLSGFTGSAGTLLVLAEEAYRSAAFYDSKTRTKRSAINAYEKFLSQHPDSPRAAAVRARLDELKKGSEQ